MTDADDLKHTETRPAPHMVSDASPCSRPAVPDLFTSAKTPAPVPARHPALSEALIQASLDPAVRSILHVPTAPAGTAQVDVDVIILGKDDGRYALDVVAARRIRDIDEEGLVQIALRELGLQQLVVTAEDLKQEPRRSNCRQVWAYRNWQVALPLRLRILKALADDGPIELDRLLEMIRSDRDPLMAIFALACADLLELDLTSGQIGPMTMVRSRVRAARNWGRWPISSTTSTFIPRSAICSAA
ncbi:DNA-directed RNA polymerase subunit omega [Bradyrhizobium sp. STM 3562]|uniref:DNA-directed RNA polymerase subunit omega n=1 Tax=Bradyrhizobium sp. STM 3562 TaxID=578924 RepID=UPI00388DBC9A